MAALCQPLGSAFDDNSATTSECNCSSIFERKKKFSRLVVDTNALIKGIRLDFIAEKLYTVKEVLEEVRDRNSRRLLTIHPYEFIIRHPSSVALKSVREFARQTGDLNSLSVVDLKVLALVYTLECELKGSAEHIKTMPLIEDKKDFPEVNSSAFDYKRTESYSNYKNYKKEPIQQENKLTVTAGGVIEDRNDLSLESEDETWITPDNIVSRSCAFDAFGDTCVDAHFKDVEVACLTTDFAMQNILIQMGLHVASVDGMLIKRVKTFVFRCYACHRTAHEKDIHFCPFCGNSTLQKISASVDENGTCLYLSNSRLNLRGKKFSIPPFKGGRSANNVIIKSDQKEYLRARALAKKQADKVHVWGDHAQSSFPYSTAPSKAALSFTKRNPNEVRRTGNRKRKNRKI